MINIKIDNIEVQVENGSTILEAAKKANVHIPAMCYQKGFEHNNTCMVCLVKNRKSNKIIPSCSSLVEENMDISTIDDEIRESRKTALELLLSDHIGDCEAPCTLTCPANMDIPEMNRLIGQKKYREALILVKRDIALPATMGYICPAPCEKGCKRKPIDESVSICRLKRFVAEEDLNSNDPYLPEKEKSSGKKVAIIGAGPAGLSSAYYLLQKGHACFIYDMNSKAGGEMMYKIGEEKLPTKVLEKEIEIIEKLGATFILETTVNKEYYEKEIKPNHDVIILASGNQATFIPELEKGKTGIKVDPKTFETNLKGVFAGGNAIKEGKMAIRSLAHGKQIAQMANLYLNGQEVKPNEKAFNSSFGALIEEEFEEYFKESSRSKRVSKMDDLSGFTEEEALQESERCMHCDCRKKDNCLLRDYSTDYKADRRKYWPEQRQPVRKNIKKSNVIYEPEKCIKCNICVQIAERANEELGLTHIGRGFDVEICVPFSNSIDDGLKMVARECVESCPTGALSFKNAHKL